MQSVSDLSALFPQRDSAATSAPRTVEEMNSEDFLALMVAQLENQNPTKPLDNMQFMAQLAQFGTVSGIQELQDGLSELTDRLTSNRALEAAGLVGREVVTGSNIGILPEPQEGDGARLPLNGVVEMPAGVREARIFVQDMTGRLVYSGTLPAVEGRLPVQWDGVDASGELMQPGAYRLSAEAVRDGEPVMLPVYASQRVTSVSLDSSTREATLHLASGQTAALNDVLSFL
jgi:flagellar basal-body rod modification protein FlgD